MSKRDRRFKEPTGKGFLHKVLGLSLFVVFLAAGVCSAADRDGEYFRIYDLVQQAEQLETQGKVPQATEKYREAQKALRALQIANPGWNSQVINYRLNTITTKITQLTQNPPAPEAPRQAEQSPAVASKAVETGRSQIKLLEPGKEPRKVLRLHPKPGDTQSLEMNMNLGLDLNMAGIAQPMKVPGMKMLLDLKVKDVSSDGTIECETVVNGFEIATEPASPLADLMKNSLGGLKGLTISGKYSNQGVDLGGDMKLPSGTDPQARQQLEQMRDSLKNMTSPLPEEPVGVGAKWQVKLQIKSQGMTMDQISTCELISLEGDRYTTRSEVVQTAANQKIQNPAVPGLKMDLKKMAGKGTGTSSLDTSKLLPLEAKIQFNSDASFSMDAGGQSQAMDIKTSIEVQLKSK
jgi:hypothetical protein